jgi:hypothetical protein
MMSLTDIQCISVLLDMNAHTYVFTLVVNNLFFVLENHLSEGT